MTYVVESGSSSSRRSRRVRAGVTLLVVILMLFFAFWYAYSYYRSDGSETPAGPAACPSTTATAAAALPSKTLVNVYNATSRSGLAAKTAAELTKRGYVVDKVANDPLKRTIAGVGEVRYGTTGVAEAKAVLVLVPGAPTRRDARTDASVDLVLGDTFASIAPVSTPPAAGRAC